MDLVAGFSMSALGLLLVAIGWLLQAMAKKKETNKQFLMLYCLGVILLVVDGFSSGLMMLAGLNLVCLVLAAYVLFRQG